MFEFDYPWMYVLLVLPFIVRLFFRPYKEQREAVQAPFFEKLKKITGQAPGKGAVILRPRLFQKLMLPLAWVLIVTALARPQWVEDPITKIESGRDLLLAVDLSGSMEERDFTDPEGNRIDRLEAVKLVLNDFINRREGDRLGLILFGTTAYLQVPFTQDYSTFRLLLDEAQVRMAGPQTMIGDAIGLAIKLFAESDSENKVMILLTDGNDTGSQVPPARAAGIASQNDVTIHTIAMGDPTTVGEQKLDITALQEISEIAGGRYFMGMNREELEDIYTQLDELEPVEFETISYRPRQPLYFYPLGIFFIIYLIYHLFMALRSLMGRKERPAHV
ncbi:MAG: VWA domain-containing protein [Candidatus Aminicenantes bacterium]|nr:VWA domain-containing protein [Candidatus Aminicenantes bacterium]